MMAIIICVTCEGLRVLVPCLNAKFVINTLKYFFGYNWLNLYFLFCFC